MCCKEVGQQKGTNGSHCAKQQCELKAGEVACLPARHCIGQTLPAWGPTQDLPECIAANDASVSAACL